MTTIEEALAAVRTLHRLGYEWNGGELWKPPLGAASRPSIPGLWVDTQFVPPDDMGGDGGFSRGVEAAAAVLDERGMRDTAAEVRQLKEPT
jgi:hypothetical protein